MTASTRDGLTAADAARLRAALEEALPAARALRRELHREPRLSGHEQDTLTAVLQRLPGAVEAVASTGAVVRLGGPGPAVAVRAELDALPIREDTGVPDAAVNGAMHACGHDVHLAAVTALAAAVEAAAVPVPLVLLLQPREETYPSGAADVVASGVLQRHQVGMVLAAHVQPTLPIGTTSTGSGAVNAAADEFTVTVHGQGGHGAYPHLTTDPVLALAHVVVAAQAVVSRAVDPTHAAVVTFGVLEAGTAPNVIPGLARARGTLRVLAAPDRPLVHGALERIVEATAAAHGCRGTLDVVPGEPVLRNDPVLAAAVEPHLRAAGVRVVPQGRSCGADDFSFYADVVPGLMMFVGVHVPDGVGLHSSRFHPDDDAVDDVARTLLAGYLGGCGALQERPG